MDFIFEDDVDEVGSDIEAYCPKCKGDTSHTVITKYEEEIRRVQCSPCGDVHGYRKPRGEAEEDIPEPVAAKKRAASKKPSWDEARAKVGDKKMSHPRPYSIRDTYGEGDIVNHPKFGVGFVTEISENKAEITFQDERRVLIHNRPDLAAQMPAIAPLPPPREEKKGKGKGKGKGKEVVAPKGKAAVAKSPPPVAPPAKTAGAAAKTAAAAVKTAAAAAKTAAAAKAAALGGKKAERARAAVEKKSAAKGAKKAPPRPAAKKPAAKTSAARKSRPAAARRPAAKPAKKKAAKAKKR